MDSVILRENFNLLITNFYNFDVQEKIYNKKKKTCKQGKTQKHTAAEIKAKHKAAKEAKGAAGGGNSGAEKRKADKESANKKLKDLGLTDDEISALTGS